VVIGVDDDEAVGLRLADIDEEARIGLLVHQDIVLPAGAQCVAEDAGRAVVGVEPDIEEEPAVRRTRRRSAGVGHHVGEVGAGFEVANRKRVELRPGIVVRPGEQLVVGEWNEPPMRNSPRPAASALPSSSTSSDPPSRRRRTCSGMLAAFDEARCVGDRAVGRGDGRVVLLDAAAHLPEKLSCRASVSAISARK
jgi:hypothetical protein